MLPANGESFLNYVDSGQTEENTSASQLAAPGTTGQIDQNEQ